MYSLCPICKEWGVGVQHNPNCVKRLDEIDRLIWQRHVDQDGSVYYTRRDGKEYPM